jgi:hypothetical protein
VIEQETIPAPAEAASASPQEDKPAKESKPAKKTIAKTAKKDPNKKSSLTDEQKRLARNAALREWRKKNKDKWSAYMKQWRSSHKQAGAADSSPKKAQPTKKPASAKRKAGGMK